MSRVRATYKNGQVKLKGPADWPEGCELDVGPFREASVIDEEDRPRTPAEIEGWLQWYDSLEPLELAAKEEFEIASWEKEIGDYTIANMQKDVDGLFR